MSVFEGMRIVIRWGCREIGDVSIINYQKIRDWKVSKKPVNKKPVNTIKYLKSNVYIKLFNIVQHHPLTLISTP